MGKRLTGWLDSDAKRVKRGARDVIVVGVRGENVSVRMQFNGDHLKVVGRPVGFAGLAVGKEQTIWSGRVRYLSTDEVPDIEFVEHDPER